MFWQDAVYALLAVGEVDLYAVLAMEVLCQMLGAIDGTMLAAGAAEGEHEVGEAPLEVALDVGVGQSVDGVEEGENLAVMLQKLDDGGVESCELLVRFVAPRVVGASAVEDVASAVAAGVFGYAELVGEGENADKKGGGRLPPCCSPSREGGSRSGALELGCRRGALKLGEYCGVLGLGGMGRGEGTQYLSQFGVGANLVI